MILVLSIAHRVFTLMTRFLDENPHKREPLTYQVLARDVEGH